ncbi:coiled-coil domain-containing protein 30 isoform X3 [Microcaecilia unicolor]|uniref:Coiled-coil domain-containing protein 30 isoform X3 n=1 Tax=Microcaecilia unicolor TaxID=1415580 RepID=A0A6P7WU96_9AMPH|nr:coiled-coil domain-containing protein 30 isoform X3 [Microcaecilia unicolor]
MSSNRRSGGGGGGGGGGGNGPVLEGGDLGNGSNRRARHIESGAVSEDSRWADLVPFHEIGSEEAESYRSLNLSSLEKSQLEDILDTLKEEGLDPFATPSEQLSYLWCLYQRSEGKLWSATRDLEKLQQQQAEEMKEVESYVDHVRNLTEEREGVASKFEKENDQLKTKLEHLQLQHEAQAKEVEEMLDQEGLLDISHSNPSEQIAYLLVERATLLERLDLTEHNLGFHNSNQESHLQACDEELERERKLRVCVERDLDEAAHRLHMAHDEIRRLTDELDMKKKEQSKPDTLELQKARDHNKRLDKEILALRNRVRSLDLQRKDHTEVIEKLKKELDDHQKKGEQGALSSTVNDAGEDNEQGEHSKSDIEEKSSRNVADSDQLGNLQSDETLHKRCQQEIEDKECRNKELLHKFKKLEHEYEELVERNEELESVLGETQNQRKEENQLFECETEGLKRKISKLEAELSEMQRSKEEELCFFDQETSPDLKAEDLQQMLKNSQENIEILDSRLLEERSWRQQLESDLETAQKALRVVKEKSKFEPGRLQLEVTNLDETAKEECFPSTIIEKHQWDSGLLENEIFKFTEGFDILNTHGTEERNIDKETEKLWFPKEREIENLTTKASSLQDTIQSLQKGGENLSSELSESKRKIDIVVAQLQECIGEKRAVREENARLRQEISCTRLQLLSVEEEMAKLKEERHQGSQSSGAGTDSIVKLHSSGEILFQQQQQEDVRQLRQDLHRVQNLCSSAEKELRYEREKTLDLKKHNILLQQEITKVKADLRQAQGKQSELSNICKNLETELDQSQQKVKELELDVLKQNQSAKLQSSWQEKLAHEVSRANDADRKVLDLQQQLKELRHQLCLSDTHVLGKKHLEEEAKTLREHESKLRQQLEAGQWERKLQDQNIEELQGHLKNFRNKETSLVQANAELQLRVQQQETRLRVLEEERAATTSENSNQKLTVQLSVLQQEKERLYQELDHALKHLDDRVRKYNEKELRHKAKLRKAKEVYVHELHLRDGLIKQLQNEIALMRNHNEKEKAWIRKVTTENETLLQEKRCLLQQATDQEEIGRNNKWLLSSIQSRVHFLDEENKQLQDSALRLSNQVVTLERILKKIQTLNVEDLKKTIPSECFQLNEKLFSLPVTRMSILTSQALKGTLSTEPSGSKSYHSRSSQQTTLGRASLWHALTPASRDGSFPAVGLSNSLGILKTVPAVRNKDVPESLRAAFSFSQSQPSEISYLNLTSPAQTLTFPEEKHDQSTCSDEADEGE